MVILQFQSIYFHLGFEIAEKQAGGCPEWGGRDELKGSYLCKLKVERIISVQAAGWAEVNRGGHLVDGWKVADVNSNMLDRFFISVFSRSFQKKHGKQRLIVVGMVDTVGMVAGKWGVIGVNNKTLPHPFRLEPFIPAESQKVLRQRCEWLWCLTFFHPQCFSPSWWRNVFWALVAGEQLDFRGVTLSWSCWSL